MAIKISLDFCSFENNPPLTQQSRLQNLKQGYRQYDILSSLFLKFFVSNPFGSIKRCGRRCGFKTRYQQYFINYDGWMCKGPSTYLCIN